MVPGRNRFDVRADAAFVAKRAQFVGIDADAIRTWAREVDLQLIQPNPRPSELRFEGTPAELASWFLLLDSLNFCFWTTQAEPWLVEYRGHTWGRYYALVACLHRAVSTDRTWLEPRRWATLTHATADALFAGRGCIPMLAERLQILHEITAVTLDEFEGRPLRLVEQASYDAVQIAHMLAEAFPSFRDVHTYAGREIAILKRAQIFAADLAVSLQRAGGSEIVNLDGLTAFADYRIPQMLRHLGVLRLAPEIERVIEAGEFIASSSEAEIELRCCSIEAVERMVAALQTERGVNMPAWIVDEYLWDRSHQPDVHVQHHRTLTICY